MVGQADTRSSLQLHQGSSLINQRELILLSLGLTKTPVTVPESYTLVKNLQVRIKSILAYPVPPFEIYREIITKMIKEKTISQTYSLKHRKYVINLSDGGEGEFDFLIHSIVTPKLLQIFDEYRSLIELFR